MRRGTGQGGQAGQISSPRDESGPHRTNRALRDGSGSRGTNQDSSGRIRMRTRGTDQGPTERTRPHKTNQDPAGRIRTLRDGSGCRKTNKSHGMNQGPQDESVPRDGPGPRHPQDKTGPRRTNQPPRKPSKRAFRENLGRSDSNHLTPSAPLATRGRLVI